MALPQYLYFLAACTVSATIYAVKKALTFHTIVGVFFWVLLSVEVACFMLPETDAVYNFWYPVEFAFYCCLLLHYMQYRYKRVLYFLPALLVVFCYAYHITHWQNRTVFYTTGLRVAAVLLFSFVLLKAYELTTEEVRPQLPFATPLLWFLLGLVLDVASILLLGMKDYLLHSSPRLYFYLQYANQILSSAQYVCFTICFYLFWKYPS
jgi:hypothetical protein